MRIWNTVLRWVLLAGALLAGMRELASLQGWRLRERLLRHPR